MKISCQNQAEHYPPADDCATHLLKKALTVFLSICCLSMIFTASSHAETYAYDKAGRLTGVSYDDGSSLTYTYDAAGNIIAKGPDTDNDGLPDSLESTTCTDPNDADTDDDGIIDGAEDANHNGDVDPGETSPCNIDSDGDGIQDGTESGITTPAMGSDTDMGVFQPDLDFTTTTNPLDKDTDGDGCIDGVEDPNHNGRIDPGEKDPNDPGSMFEEGDINCDGSIDLTDALLVFQILVGIEPRLNIHKEPDPEGGNNIGLEDVIYTFQKISGLR
jgi:YD repeat-containing protein